MVTDEHADQHEYERMESQPRKKRRLWMDETTLVQKIVAALVAVLGILGGYGAYQGQQMGSDPNARADPWTGTQAHQQEERLTAEHDKDITSIWGVISEIRAQIRSLEECKARVEQQLKQGSRERQQIIDLLERVHPRVPYIKGPLNDR